MLGTYDYSVTMFILLLLDGGEVEPSLGGPPEGRTQHHGSHWHMSPARRGASLSTADRRLNQPLSHRR